MAIQLSILDYLEQAPVTPLLTLVQPSIIDSDCPVSILDIREQFYADVEIWTTEKDGSCQELNRHVFTDGNIAGMAGESSPLNSWQKVAYHFALQNQDCVLIVGTKTHTWEIYRNGENVAFALPHEGRGGERKYITRDGMTKLLVSKNYEPGGFE